MEYNEGLVDDRDDKTTLRLPFLPSLTFLIRK
jgi:hypothetical protein